MGHRDTPSPSFFFVFFFFFFVFVTQSLPRQCNKIQIKLSQILQFFFDFFKINFNIFWQTVANFGQIFNQFYTNLYKVLTFLKQFIFGQFFDKLVIKFLQIVLVFQPFLKKFS
jgi:hypothetical protein